MIDLHAHVLPGIDDGPATVAEAVEAVAAAAREGVRMLAATPHVRPDHPAVRPAELGHRTAVLAEDCAAAGIAGLTLVSGGEIDLAWAQTADDEALAAASYGGRGLDLLVETPYGELPGGFEELVFRISARGFRVLLAHPERSPTLQRDTRRLQALVERGTLLQLTAAALASTDRRSAAAGSPSHCSARASRTSSPPIATARTSCARVCETASPPPAASPLPGRTGWSPTRRPRSCRRAAPGAAAGPTPPCAGRDAARLPPSEGA